MEKRENWRQKECKIASAIDERNCARTGRDGKAGLRLGRENSRDGKKTPYVGMVDGGNKNQLRERSGNRGR